MSPAPHPDKLYSRLVEKGGRPLKLRNLEAIHDLCREQHTAGSRDFSISAIGKLCQARGILVAKGLYNASLADYRALIDAWGTYAGPSTIKPPKHLATEQWVARIADPAIRTLTNEVITERNKLIAQINTLKSQKTFVVDRRPVESASTLILAPSLTDSERKCLEKVISTEFLKFQGWREGDFGEVINESGRAIFAPGFITAIRKILNCSSAQPKLG